MFRLCFVVACLGCYVSGQVITLQGCPKVNVQKNFDIKSYMGRWYEQERFFAIFEFAQRCGTAEYTLRSDGIVTVNNTGLNRIGREYTTAIGDAAVQDNDMPSKLGVKFFSGQPRGNYWVLSTDYTTYSVVWSCGDAGLLNTQFCWILSRASEGLPKSTMSDIYAMLHSYNIDTSKFSDAGQTNCPGR